MLDFQEVEPNPLGLHGKVESVNEDAFGKIPVGFQNLPVFDVFTDLPFGLVDELPRVDGGKAGDKQRMGGI